MNQKGIANVFALKGGIQGWKAAGFPVEAGK
jgi:rhodanese-related sulfurtransferase